MKNILCFGDSNTYGLIAGTKDRYDEKIRWTGILAEKLKDRGCHIIEEGLCGRTTIFDDPLRAGRRGTQLLPIILETHKPIDLIILMLGTNDCKIMNDATPQLIGLGIRRLISQIKQETPEAKVLLVSPIFLGDGVWEEGYDPEFDEKSVRVSRQLPQVYRKIAEEENLYYLAASDFAVPSEEDREHLDKEGHGRLAYAIYDKVLDISYNQNL